MPTFQPPVPWVPDPPAAPTPEASPSQAAAPAAVPAAPIPGLADLWQAYLHSLARHPLFTKAATSFFCVCLGDLIAQAIGGAPLSASRMLRLAAYSSTVGAATGHYWHRWLEAHVCPDSPTCNRSVVTKMALDQLVLTPVMTAVFFVALKLMEGRPDTIVPFMQEKYVQTLLAGYAVWVPWNYASFKWIPQDLRILAGNLVGIGWGTFVSVSCINNAGPSTPSACPAVMAALEAVPAACPTVMAAVEAAALGPQ